MHVGWIKDYLLCTSIIILFLWSSIYFLYLYVAVLFSLLQFEAIHQYINNGGSVLFMLTEGGEARLNTNVNFFLEEYGVMVNPGK